MSIPASIPTRRPGPRFQAPADCPARSRSGSGGLQDPVGAVADLGHGDRRQEQLVGTGIQPFGQGRGTFPPAGSPRRQGVRVHRIQGEPYSAAPRTGLVSRGGRSSSSSPEAATRRPNEGTRRRRFHSSTPTRTARACPCRVMTAVSPFAAPSTRADSVALASRSCTVRMTPSRTDAVTLARGAAPGNRRRRPDQRESTRRACSSRAARSRSFGGGGAATAPKKRIASPRASARVSRLSMALSAVSRVLFHMTTVHPAHDSGGGRLSMRTRGGSKPISASRR